MTPQDRPAGEFFSPVPRPVFALLADGTLARPDVAVLGVLLDYKGRDSTVVFPSQRTLAERLGCSLDTLQRGLRRLAAAGLIAKQYVHDSLGRLRGLSYDLAAVLRMMPAKAAKLRQGEWGAETPEPKPPARGPEGEDEQESVQADDAAPGPAQTEAAGLASAGVSADVAARLVRQFGADACRRQREWLPARSNVRDPAAALVAAIRQNWAPPVSASGAAPAPVRHFVPRPPDAPDPLAGRSPEERARLERAASEALCREMPGLAPLVASGRAGRLVRERMRRLAREGQ